MVTRISFRWTPEELFYKIFCKKECFICKKKLKHYWEKKYVGITQGFGAYGDSGDEETNQYFDVYKCENCNRKYSIGELAKERKRRKREA